MSAPISRRDALTNAAALGVALGGAGLAAATFSGRAEAQNRARTPEPQAGLPSATEPRDRFYREDWFGEPWREPQAIVLIHGALESGIVWYAWVPTLSQHYRVVRPDLPGCGLSVVPANFDWSFAGLAVYVASVLDKAGVESAHIVGAKTGGPIAMQFAADFPRRTRSLSVVSGPASVIQITNPSPVPQKDRLGSRVSAEMAEYWTAMEKSAPAEGTAGLNKALSNFDLERDGVLQRIEAPSLVITSDRSALQSVEKVRKYQTAIRNSRLVVLNSDAYHIAVAEPQQCLANVLAFVREHA